MRSNQPVVSVLLSLKNRFIACLALVLVLSPGSVTALDVILTWDANTETGIGGYRVFMRQGGESYDYKRPEWRGRTTSCTTPNLDDETNYCFVVRAVGNTGAESGDSNEACTYYGTACAGSAEASGYGTNPVCRPSDLGKHLAYLLFPLGAVIGLRIWGRKR